MATDLAAIERRQKILAQLRRSLLVFDSPADEEQAGQLEEALGTLLTQLEEGVLQPLGG